jgi:hypothetical protein
MIEKYLLPQIVTTETISTLHLLTLDITPSCNDSEIAILDNIIVANKRFNSTPTSVCNLKKDILQNYCYNLPTDSEKFESDEPIEIPVSKKMVFKFAQSRKVLLY